MKSTPVNGSRPIKEALLSFKIQVTWILTCMASPTQHFPVDCLVIVWHPGTCHLLQRVHRLASIDESCLFITSFCVRLPGAVVLRVWIQKGHMKHSPKWSFSQVVHRKQASGKSALKFRSCKAGFPRVLYGAENLSFWTISSKFAQLFISNVEKWWPKNLLLYLST